MKSMTWVSPDSRMATPIKSEKNNGAATGNSRQSNVHSITAKASFWPDDIGFLPAGRTIFMPRNLAGIISRIR